jgi:hypothetical protein
MRIRNGAVRGEQGMTLIEFTMAGAVAGVMFLVLYSILNQALAAYNIGQLRSRAVQSGRVAMVRIVDDIKYAEDIWVADVDRIFVSRPHEESGTAQLIDYRYYSGTDVIGRRLNYGVNYNFSDQVAGFSLIYRDAAFIALATPVTDVHEIRYIEVELRLEEDNFEITLRNLVVLENPVTVP